MNLTPPVLAFMVGFGLSAWLASPACPLRLMDVPNQRSLHTQYTPRTGGLAVLGGIALGWAVASFSFGHVVPLLGIVIPAVLVAGVSLADDLYRLSPWSRLLVHGIAAVILMASSDLPLLDNWGSLFVWLAIVWMINLYNFMDGMDGFAGGMAVLGFATFAILGFMADRTYFAVLSAVVSASAAGFLVFNLPPARIFMGDVGASTLGLMAAAFSLWASRDGIFPIWIGILVFSPFITDATVTLAGRAFRREKIWEAHRSHYYQRLVQMGWGHRKTVLVEYAVMFAVAISAVFLRGASHFVQLVGLAVWALLFMGFILGVRLLERQNQVYQIKASNLG